MDISSMGAYARPDADGYLAQYNLSMWEMTLGSCGTDSDAESIFYLMAHQFVAYGLTQDRWYSSNNPQCMSDVLLKTHSAV